MVRQPLSAISNSANATKILNGRIRKAPKRLIEEENEHLKEIDGCNNKKKRMAKDMSVIQNTKDTISCNSALMNTRKYSRSKNSNSSESKILAKAIESRNFVRKGREKEDKSKEQNVTTKKYNEKLEEDKGNKHYASLKSVSSYSKTKGKSEPMIESNGSFISRRTRAAKGLKLDSKLPVSLRDLSKTTSKSIKDAIISEPGPATISRKNSRNMKGSNKNSKLVGNAKVNSTICKSSDTLHKTKEKENQNSIHSLDVLTNIRPFGEQPVQHKNSVVRNPNVRKRGTFQSTPSSESDEKCLINKEVKTISKVNVAKVKSIRTSTARQNMIQKSKNVEKEPQNNTKVEPKETRTSKSPKTPNNPHETCSSSHSSQKKLSIGTVSSVEVRMENKEPTKKLQMLNTLSEKGDIPKQRKVQSLKTEAIAQMLQEEDENDEYYSDIESEKDSPKKTGVHKKAIENLSNATQNKEPNIRRKNVVHRPVYMKQSPRKIPTNVIENSSAGDITTQSVYDMPDALEEPRKKPSSTKTAKKKKQHEKKPTRKACKKERPEIRTKKANSKIRLAASTSILKRKFYENNICGLSHPSVQEYPKDNGSKSTTQPKIIRQKGCRVLSNDRGQISLFGEIENQPGAEQWVQQRVGKEKLNENASSIAEYDGDVFLPTVTECRGIEKNPNTSIPSTSRNCGKSPSIIESIFPRSNYYEGERNLQDSNINIASDIKDTSQRHLLLHPSTSLHKSTNSVNIELSCPYTTGADKSPPQMKVDIKNCFGLGESDDEMEESKDIETKRNPSFQDFSEISPVRRAGLFSPKDKSDGYLNSTRASVISPFGTKSTVIPLEQSRIISGNFLAPVKNSRYTFKKKKDSILFSAISGVPLIPRSAYAYTVSPTNIPKSISAKVEINTITTKKRNDTNHNSGQERFRVVCNEEKDCTGIASKEHEAENNLIPLDYNIKAWDKNKRVRNFNDQKPVPLSPEFSYSKKVERTVVDKNAFAFLKENTENNSSGGKACKQTKRKTAAINKPSKFQKQTLIYETVGVKKQLKAPIALKKSNISSLRSEKETEDRSQQKSEKPCIPINITSKRDYSKRPKLCYSTQKDPYKKTKKEKEREHWETLQSSHFEDVEDVELSFF